MHTSDAEDATLGDCSATSSLPAFTTSPAMDVAVCTSLRTAWSLKGIIVYLPRWNFNRTWYMASKFMVQVILKDLIEHSS